MRGIDMDKNLDLRVQKTYSCLMNAILEMLKEKDFEEITVNELCEKALVGRGTFYKHFADKYDFFSFMLSEMLNRYTSEAERRTDESDPCSYYIVFFEAFLQFMENNNALFGPPTSRSMISVMLFSTSDTIADLLEKHLRADAKKGYHLTISPVSASRFLTGAMAQSARYLIGHPEEAHKEYLIADMKILIEEIFGFSTPALSESGNEG